MTAVKERPAATEPGAVQRDTLPSPPNRRRPLLWLAAVAVIVLAGALFLVLSGDDDAATSRTAGSESAPSGMPTMGESARSQGVTSTVEVELGEMYVKPSVATVRAGKVMFVARNVGRVEHELMVERMPIKMDAPGMPTEDAAIGMIEEMAPMHRGRMTLRLRPGNYELFCNVPGHYGAGQRTMLTVTGS